MNFVKLLAMKYILNIITFLAVNAIGFLSITIMFHILQTQGYFTQIADQTAISSIFQKAIFAWLAGSAISIGYLVINHAIRYVLLLAPILAVIAYWLKLMLLSS